MRPPNMGSSPSSSVPGSTGTKRFELDEHVGVDVAGGIEVTGGPMCPDKTTFLEVLARALVAVVANEGFAPPQGVRTPFCPDQLLKINQAINLHMPAG